MADPLCSTIISDNATCNTFFQTHAQIQNPNCTQIQNEQRCDAQTYDWMMYMRIGIISASSLALVSNIVFIWIKRHYRYPTIFLFMLAQIFYLVALLSVVTHNQAYNGPQISINQTKSIFIFELPYNATKNKSTCCQVQTYFDCLIQANHAHPSAIEALINLSSYAMAYWLAVCMTMYVRHIIQSNKESFQKDADDEEESTYQTFKNKHWRFILLVTGLIVGWHVVPFILTFIKDMPFSYGPTGYSFNTNSQLLLYGGMVDRTGKTYGSALVLIWMLVLPLVLVAYHVYLLCWNYREMKGFRSRVQVQQEREGPELFLVMRSGNKLSIVIFIVQALNIIKLFLSTFTTQDEAVLVINIIFDLLAFALVFMYFWYYRNLEGSAAGDDPCFGRDSSLNLTLVS